MHQSRVASDHLVPRNVSVFLSMTSAQDERSAMTRDDVMIAGATRKMIVRPAIIARYSAKMTR
jgi:hypothetical protein